NLRSWLHMRDDLHVDAGGIHVLKADLAEIVELARRSMRRDAPRAAVTVPQLGDPKVLLDCDYSLLGRHRAPLSIVYASHFIDSERSDGSGMWKHQYDWPANRRTNDAISCDRSSVPGGKGDCASDLA